MIYTYDNAKHHHFLDGGRAPGVTTVLKTEGYISFPSHINMDEYAYRGTYVHAACHLINTGKLDYSALKPEFAPYVDAYGKWMADSKAKPLASELGVYSPIWRYCGILDGIHQMPDGVVLADIKTGATEGKSWPLQTAGYAAAYKDCPIVKDLGLPPIKYRCAIQLKKDGTYKQIDYRDKKDEREWLVVIASYNQKLAKKIIKLGDETNE